MCLQSLNNWLGDRDGRRDRELWVGRIQSGMECLLHTTSKASLGNQNPGALGGSAGPCGLASCSQMTARVGTSQPANSPLWCSELIFVYRQRWSVTGTKVRGWRRAELPVLLASGRCLAVSPATTGCKSK